MQEMLFPIEIPIKAPIIQIQIWDDDFGRDELCCCLDIPIKDILSQERKSDNENGIVKWINLYGGPSDYNSSNVSQFMNRNPEKGSEWKGRIMVEYYSMKTEYPKAKMINLKEDIIKEQLKTSMAEKEYMVIG